MTDYRYGFPDEQGRNMGGPDQRSDSCYRCGRTGHTFNGDTECPVPEQPIRRVEVYDRGPDCSRPWGD